MEVLFPVGKLCINTLPVDSSCTLIRGPSSRCGQRLDLNLAALFVDHKDLPLRTGKFQKEVLLLKDERERDQAPTSF